MSAAPAIPTFQKPAFTPEALARMGCLPVIVIGLGVVWLIAQYGGGEDGPSFLGPYPDEDCPYPKGVGAASEYFDNEQIRFTTAAMCSALGPRSSFGAATDLALEECGEPNCHRIETPLLKGVPPAKACYAFNGRILDFIPEISGQPLAINVARAETHVGAFDAMTAFCRARLGTEEACNHPLVSVRCNYLPSGGPQTVRITGQVDYQMDEDNLTNRPFNVPDQRRDRPVSP